VNDSSPSLPPPLQASTLGGQLGIVLLGVFLALAAAIALMGVHYLRRQQSMTWRMAEQQISAVADLKVRQIHRWYRENLADAGHIMDSDLASREVRQFVKDPQNSEVRARLQQWLDSLHRHYEFAQMVLVNTNLQVLLSVPEPPDSMWSPVLQRAAEAIQASRPLVTDLHRSSPGGRIHMDVLVPLIEHPNGLFGLLVIEIQPYPYLFPLIQSWPTSSETAETLLVRREGDEVLFLNELRHQSNTALNLRLPLETNGTPAAMAVLGQTGLVRGLDYRGVPVLAASRAIQDTPWSLVAKVDEAEIIQPLHQQAQIVASMTGALLLAAGLAVALVWRQLRNRQLQHALALERQSHALSSRLAAVMQQAHDIIMVTNPQGRIVEANARAVEAYGYSLSELLTLELADLRAPEARYSHSQFLDHLKTEQRMVVETVHTRKDGTIFPVEVSARRIESDGASLTLAITRDITERKRGEDALRESEHRFRSLFESMSELAVLHELVCDPDGHAVDYRVLDCNPAFCRITGISREKAVGGLASRLFGIDPAPFLEQYATVAITGESRTFEAFFPPMEKWFVISAFSPSVGHFATVALDITVRKLEERERERLFNELARKNEELENLLYAASHDLRSPLVNIEGFSQRLQKDCQELTTIVANPADPDSSKVRCTELLEKQLPMALRYIRSGVVTMNSLLNGLLQLSRLGREELRLERLEMNQLAVQVLDSLRFQIQKAGASVKTESLPDGWGDGRLIRRVWANLLDNALKYRDPERPLQIALTGETIGQEAIYCVADTGIGISPQHQDKIWDLFHRLHPKGTVPGDGLGLNIVRRILSRQSGRVWVESTPGQGSRFYFALPKPESKKPSLQGYAKSEP
jgi:PAS domain S-box-containing protein